MFKCLYTARLVPRRDRAYSTFSTSWGKTRVLPASNFFYLRHNKDFTQIIVLVIISQQGSVCRFSVFFARMSVTKLKALLVFPTNKGWVLLVTPILLWGMKHITHEYVGRHSGCLQFVISLSADGKSMRRKVCWYEHFSEDFKGVTSSWPDLLDLPNPGLIRRDTLSRLFSNSLICLSSAAG